MVTNTPAGIPPFAEFLDTLHQTKPADMQLRSAITNVDAATEMHTYLVQHYTGVESVQSFEDENGSVFDCVPIAHQPGLRNSADQSPTAPDAPHATDQPAAGVARDAHQAKMISGLNQNRKDRHGNAIHCPPGAIPLRRLSPELLGRFSTLREFFQKSPSGSSAPPQSSAILPTGDSPGSIVVAPQPAGIATHRWAHASQGVANLGGHSILNVWDPVITGNQVFSLSQQWYVAGSGKGLQTAEAGWQVYPKFYNGTKPVFFIYWTADDYNQTGCYNHSCGAFVQTNNNWAIGGALAPSSTQGGAQFEIDISFYLHAGRWWLYVGGGAAKNAIGYYPASIYKGGAMAAHAASIDFGGETVGITSWPPMGGGKFANAGWQHAAYQRDITYFPTAGGAVSANLTKAQASPQCFTATVEKFGPPWNETIFFGGPGGSNC